MTTLQDKLAAIQWPKDIERIGAYHVYLRSRCWRCAGSGSR